jgi:hypothetical protein
MNRYLLLLISISVICTAPSCKLYRRITGKQKLSTAADSSLVVRDTARTQPDTVAAKLDSVVTPPIDLNQQALLASLLPRWNEQLSWQTFDGKAKVHYEGKGESRDFTATFRMEKGSRIWVSVTALGIMEVARVLITPDTVQFIDRFNKKAHILPFNQLGSLLPIRGDFASLQSLIIGDAMQTGHQPNQAKDTADELIVSYISPEFNQRLQFSKADTSLHIQAISAPEAFLLCLYSDYITEAGHRFAASRALSMADKAEQHSLNMEFNKVAFNEAIETPFSIPAKYERN